MVSDRQLIKASLVAGLKLWGIGGWKGFIEEHKIWFDKYSINPDDYDVDKYGSGLCWNWLEDSRIERQKFSERVKELIPIPDGLESLIYDIENVGEIVDNITDVTDFEYVFWPDGTGLIKYNDLLDPNIRYKDGKVYTFSGEDFGIIFVYEMDLKTREEVEEYVKKILDKRR